jgi:uncharacterized surface protein with fasciclin (FAS1) repeats
MKISVVVSALIPLAVLAACDSPSGGKAAAESPAASPPLVAAAAAPAERPKGSNTVVDVALGSPDHTTLVAALKAGDLVEALDSPGGVYTIFAPTNAAFAKLPKGTVEDLLKPEKKADLRRVLQHHAAVPSLQVKDMHDGQSLAMSDGTKVTFHVKGGKVSVDDANIVGSVTASNGVVHVVDTVILPPAK